LVISFVQELWEAGGGSLEGVVGVEGVLMGEEVLPRSRIEIRYLGGNHEQTEKQSGHIDKVIY
jgi:hypothetical protein